MNYGEIKDQVKRLLRVNNTQLDTLIEEAVNREYRGLARKYNWPALRVNLATITTEADTSVYALPYIFDRMAENGLIYDVSSITGGYENGTLLPQMSEGNASPLMAGSVATDPFAYMIGRNGQSAYYSTGTVAVTSGGTAVTGTSTTWTSAMVGMWMRFGTSATLNGGDYGYQISAVGSTTSITLASAYRGPTLTGVTYQIRPANSLWIRFLPSMTAGSKTVLISYFRKPERLYSSDDVPEVDELSECIAYQSALNLATYHSDREDAVMFGRMARTAYNDALKCFLP